MLFDFCASDEWKSNRAGKLSESGILFHDKARQYENTLYGFSWQDLNQISYSPTLSLWDKDVLGFHSQESRWKLLLAILTLGFICDQAMRGIMRWYSTINFCHSLRKIFKNFHPVWTLAMTIGVLIYLFSKSFIIIYLMITDSNF